MASDPKADARILGPERTAALVAAAVVESLRDEARDLQAAARRLATPEPAAPQWPERVWAHFRGDTGEWGCCTLSGGIPMGWRVLPARLVPLDGSRVVLTREDFREARERLRHCRCHYGEHPNFDRLLAALDAALAAGGGA